MVDSKGNSKFDLRVKGLINFSSLFHKNVTFMNQVHGCKALYFAHNFDELLISLLSSRIAEWVSKQAEREREKEQKKQERLARRRSMPKHMFDDKTYTQNIQQNSERIEAALHQGEVLA